MTKKFYFTPGPSQLYFTVENHLKKAINEQIPSISHRSKTFEHIYEEAVTNLKKLLNLGDSHTVLFTASATEIWERIGQNLVFSESFHMVNGAFSSRFHETMGQLGKNAYAETAADGTVVDIEKILIPETTELIAFTINETSTGACQPAEDLYKIRKAFPNQLIAADMVSAAPAIDLDYSQVDTAYFSVQKCFGLPAGLGVWIINSRCIKKCEEILNKGLSIGSYHSLPVMLEKALKNQTPETPNVLNIYLLGKVARDMLTKGLAQVRRETDYKAAVLYQAFEQAGFLTPFVENPNHRSKTTPVAACEVSAQKIINNLAKKRLVIGSGYGRHKEEHIRIANFPTHSKEHIEMIADQLLVMEF